MISSVEMPGFDLEEYFSSPYENSTSYVGSSLSGRWHFKPVDDGKFIMRIAPDALVTNFCYDSQKRLYATTDEKGQASAVYGYDKSGNLADFATVRPPMGNVAGGKATVAYLIPWGTNSAARVLARLYRSSVRVHQADKEFKLEGKTYPRGSLIIKVKDNPANLFEILKAVSQKESLEIYATNTSWVEEGVNFGSTEVNYLKKPKIAMAYNTPVSSTSVGWTRFLLERAYEYPVTVIHTNQLRGADLSKYNVLILPDAWGRYGDQVGEAGVRKLKDWVQQGGTLIAYGSATQWLTEEKIGLLAKRRYILY